ncbi:hypothetical protein [Nakamurella endophytica]|uniref:hypothetical protein n=1 Tax=Nakamurella endophytica TaxID=1748367 RepID=UPI00166369A6|nr:hypothetical protein [Nakamurella endophytica]
MSSTLVTTPRTWEDGDVERWQAEQGERARQAAERAGQRARELFDLEMRRAGGGGGHPAASDESSLREARRRAADALRRSAVAHEAAAQMHDDVADHLQAQADRGASPDAELVGRIREHRRAAEEDRRAAESDRQLIVERARDAATAAEDGATDDDTGTGSGDPTP